MKTGWERCLAMIWQKDALWDASPRPLYLQPPELVLRRGQHPGGAEASAGLRIWIRNKKFRVERRIEI